jgi:hypothetical protein
LGYSPVGLEDSGLDARFLSGGPVQVFSYGWTEFEVSAGSQELRITTYGIPAHKVPTVDTLLLSPAVVSELVVSPQRPRLRIARETSGVGVSWDASFEGYTLEQSESLSSGWTAVAVSSAGLEFKAVVPDAGTGTRYFRLIRR